MGDEQKQYKTSETQRDKARAWQAKNPFRQMWLNAGNRAWRAGRSFTITEDDVKAKWPADGKCPVLGTVMVPPGTNRGTRRTGPRPDSASLDRIDNSRGYEPDNIAIISWRANRIKEAANAAEIQAVATWLQMQGLL